jgi:hypothetical protein
MEPEIHEPPAGLLSSNPSTYSIPADEDFAQGNLEVEIQD